MPVLRSRSKRITRETCDEASTKRYAAETSLSTSSTEPNLSHNSKKNTSFIQDGRPIVTGASSPPAANITPPEILLPIFAMLTPRDFDNARRTCSQWMKISLNPKLLKTMLKRAGWWDSWQQDYATQRPMSHLTSYESEVWRMSKRFATECLLSGRRSNIERSGFVKVGVVEFSGLGRSMRRRKTRGIKALPDRNCICQNRSTFSVSSCSNYVLATAGCTIYVFRLMDRSSKSMTFTHLDNSNLVPITSIECPHEVLSATMDTSTPRFLVAALLGNRTGMICDINLSRASEDDITTSCDDSVDDASNSPSSKPARNNIYSMPTSKSSSPHYYYNVCSEDHPPRTIALYPGRQCVAFGCAGGIEIHWVDEATQKDQRRHFPMSQPSEILHFLPNSLESPSEMRLISSLAGPGVHESACRQSPFPDHPKKCHFNFRGDSKFLNQKARPNNSSLSLVRATHCHHYRAVPINDGYHIAFIEPRTGLLCIGSDAPIGGPTSLTRAFVCIPPFGKDPTTDATKEARVPTAFAVGSDLRWGLRVVAAYQGRIVLYSVPLDIFNVICKERERQVDSILGNSDPAYDWYMDPERSHKQRESLVQNQNEDWEFLLSVSYSPAAMMWPFKIYGKEIGRVENVVELALQSSNGGARIWAFSASGEASIFDIDTLTSPTCGAENIPCAMVKVGSDGSIDSAGLVERPKPGSMAPPTSRKRKSSVLQDDFVGRYGTSRYVPSLDCDGLKPVNAIDHQGEESSIRRPSFAACIVDFKIPELGIRNSSWKKDEFLLKGDH
ncbi:hypothetical protein N7493_005408 [Penicillium malachiteum]|uniref:F-box domain-containing protein n=1 Tax=Penicillium malachiteum TaxID=1324776 RepID=A0AAD6MWH0_9EURO|nr:hypothetical protein N7493_005408 [Penicillium malachiteum]